MVKGTLLIISLFSFSSIAQTGNVEITAYKTQLPGGGIQCGQYYGPASSGYVNNLLIVYSYKRRKMKSTKTNEVENSASFDQACDFIKAHMNDSLYQLPLSSFDCDSADLSILEEKGLIEDSKLTINFNLFLRQAHKVVSPCENCLPVVYFEGHQIDGERVRFKIKADSTEIIELNVGSSERSSLKSFKDWMLFYHIYNQYDLFRKIEIESYFSREKLSSEIARYIEVLKR